MKKILAYLVFGLCALLACGCESVEYRGGANGKVELYLIDTYSTIDNSCQIDEHSVVTEASPLIYFSDFLSYDSTECIFELSDRAIAAIQNLEHSMLGLAFAIKADDALVYTGYFWPGYSSASCDWIVIDPFMTSWGNKIQVKLGYPGLLEGQVIQDKRNDPVIIRIFKNVNKLR